jgi:hypothetical protein
MSKKINKGYYREVADRTFIIQSNIEEFLLGNPASREPYVKERLEKVQKLLSQVYNKTASKS